MLSPSSILVLATLLPIVSALNIPVQNALQLDRRLPDLSHASIEELQDGMREGLFTSRELIKASLSPSPQAYTIRSQSVSHLNAVLEYNPRANAQAIGRGNARAHAKLEGGHAEKRLGLLWGIPVLIKE
ncbi:hypothetical protein FRB97_004930 [Tulasnella sp. 331]|nr:hypothetical protein FRB97_004930 [Tulasnella sp. 331]